MDLWEKCYISKYPELEIKCKEDYSLNGYDWKQIAKEMVFNRTKEDFSKMVLAHELCHVIHFHIRGEDKLPSSIDSNIFNEGIWYLYEEGFAQFFQYKLLDKEVDTRGKEWFDICRANERQLKNLYLKALFDEEKGTQDFLGAGLKY